MRLKPWVCVPCGARSRPCSKTWGEPSCCWMYFFLFMCHIDVSWCISIWNVSCNIQPASQPSSNKNVLIVTIQKEQHQRQMPPRTTAGLFHSHSLWRVSSVPKNPHQTIKVWKTPLSDTIPSHHIIWLIGVPASCKIPQAMKQQKSQRSVTNQRLCTPLVTARATGKFPW